RGVGRQLTPLLPRWNVTAAAEDEATRPTGNHLLGHHQTEIAEPTGDEVAGVAPPLRTRAERRFGGPFQTRTVRHATGNGDLVRTRRVAQHIPQRARRRVDGIGGVDIDEPYAQLGMLCSARAAGTPCDPLGTRAHARVAPTSGLRAARNQPRAM